MKKVAIQVSEAVWRELVKRKTKVGDTFDKVLRRLLASQPNEMKEE